ncbi:nuclear transport factor 2 family protein [Sphingomonas sp. CL5.1]|uniref:nuclear transport factor 2 family protein n=1 Tax=Sphingomonas sp. CL5.1 TaxID=2653203 RepID=UPI001582F2D1|nr:nuclear transport factor 2 family protein [Sphingomonas sp. CL5.1]QKS00625.1 nuclear transport factor 2 family protein [Sphingomonas sp. CL5.1]
MQRLIDKDEIRDAIVRYAHGVDRGDWEMVRSGYHPDAYDAHGEYCGGVDGLLRWLDERFAGVDNSMHFLGQSLFEFAGPELALVETCFVSHRLRAPTSAEASDLAPDDAIVREGWGRYVDRFERRNGQWRVAHRTVVMEAMSSAIGRGGRRKTGPQRWSDRKGSDRVNELRVEIFGRG